MKGGEPGMATPESSEGSLVEEAGLVTDPGADFTAAAGAAGPGRAPRARPGRLGQVFRSDLVSRSATIVAFLILIGPVYGALLGGEFFNAQSRVFDIYQNTPPLILAVGIVIPLACGQFDLSVAPLATLCAFMTIGLPVNQGISLWLAIPIALAVGLLVGLVNGFLVVRVHVNAFIATLATSGVVVGAYTVYSGGETITPSTRTGKFAGQFKAFVNFGTFSNKAPLVVTWVLVIVLLASSFVVVSDRWLTPANRGRLVTAATAGYAIVIVALAVTGILSQVNWSIIVLFTLTWLIWAFFRLTVHGRALYAIGGSRTAAGLAGVPVRRYLFGAFLASGGVAAISGIMLAASQGTAVPGIADGFLLPAYAAAFLSTVILSTGRFHVWGTLAGGLFVVWVAQGLVLGGISYTWTDVINGVVLVCAVAFSTALRADLRNR
jgi:ribose/xylose/arabinose/galactoside ABC-type transport system permease subunit